MVSNLYNGHLPMGLCLDQGSLLQVGQLAAGCLTILEMAVDDRRCPHSLIHLEPSV